jgi:hypothetical protein
VLQLNEFGKRPRTPNFTRDQKAAQAIETKSALAVAHVFDISEKFSTTRKNEDNHLQNSFGYYIQQPPYMFAIIVVDST